MCYRDKSAIYFSSNTTDAVRNSLKAALNIHVEAFSERYLGLPTVVGRITSGTFDYIAERARRKIQRWSERLLACAGRETLLKLMVQTIPTYLIRPFCIMLLYRYLLHYGLLLHVLSQYLCLFSLILQGLS